MKWLIEGYQKYEKTGFEDIPASCKEWKAEIAKAVDNLEDFVTDNLEQTGDEDDVVQLREIKDRIPRRLSFRDNKHLIDALSPYLGRCYKDSGVAGVRKLNFWKGWRLTQRSLF